MHTAAGLGGPLREEQWLVSSAADAAAADGAVLGRLDGEGEILATSPCGPWVALEDGVLRLQDLELSPATASAAVFDAASQGFVIADGERVFRVGVRG